MPPSEKISHKQIPNDHLHYQMSRFKTYALEGSSQPGSFQTKRVTIKLSKLFKLNYGLEETDGKLLLTPLQGNYWNQNLHGFCLITIGQP